MQSITDGDTLRATGVGRVRLIGIDTPETVDPRRPVECFGREASAFLDRLIPPGTLIRLAYDVQRTDRYGRTLAYVYRAADGVFVNAEMLRQGYAQILTVPPNVAHAEEFLALQRAARDGGIGLWSACEETAAATHATPETTAPPKTTLAPPSDGRSECDPSYPTVCIPSPPPDLDCPQISYRRFAVVPPDPHGFDGDNDGIGCEKD